ncbi:MAG TPA: N-acetylmuramoyl-L-alanine amidase [Planctomycetota bacterium]|jgi:N-acetylmuramoyl-L-alanine amidase
MMALAAAAVLLALNGGDGSGPELELDRLLQKFDLARASEAATGRETLRGPGLTLCFAPGLQVALVNGEAVPLSAPVAIAGGRIRLPADLAAVIERLGSPRTAAPSAPEREAAPRKGVPIGRPFKIVIDPGHGGIHTGCQARGGYYEKDVTLDVSRRLRGLLEAMGVEVVLTREADLQFSEDVDEDLMRRVRISDRARPDLFLSIHCNWARDPEVRGFEVYVSRDPKPDHGSSRRLAGEIRNAFRAGLDTEDRGIKEAGFKVIKHTEAPAVLVELDFISNPTISRRFGDPDHREKVAELLADAVRRFAVR